MSVQAVAGGQVGLDGAFYKGGQFMPNTENNQGKRKGKAKGKRVPIEPYKWAVEPVGYKSIWGRIQFLFESANGEMKPNATACRHYDVSIDAVSTYIANYEMGWRWISETAPFAPIETPSGELLVEN